MRLFFLRALTSEPNPHRPQRIVCADEPVRRVRVPERAVHRIHSLLEARRRRRHRARISKNLFCRNEEVNSDEEDTLLVSNGRQGGGQGAVQLQEAAAQLQVLLHISEFLPA